MKRNYLLIILFFMGMLQFSNAAWRPGEMLVEIQIKSRQDLNNIQQHRFVIDKVVDNTVALLVVPPEYDKLRSLGYEPKIVIEDMDEYSRRIAASPDFAQYHDYYNTLTLVDSLLLNFPGLIEKHTYGQSIQNRELYAVKISDNVNIDEPEPEISFDGCHHGDEIMSAEVLVLLMRELCVKYGSNPQITNLVNNREIWIYPFINPDGRQVPQRRNMAGVDLNRDWGYLWDAWGSSPAPFSQPETQAARNWINENQFVISQTNHGGTESISYPWSYRLDACPDDAPIDFLASNYSSISGYVPTLPYFQGSHGMYFINGSAKDSFYGLMGSVGWTMEVSYQKQPSSSLIPQYYNWNKPSMLYLIDMASRGVKGMVTDAVTGNPVPAIIWPGSTSNDFWPVYSDPVVGDYHKFLLPGTYSVTITANGYQPVTVNNIVVVDTGATRIDVQMQPQLGTFGYRIVFSQMPDVPNNQYADPAYSPGALGAPDNTYYSIGRNGYVIIDMGEAIFDFPGDDFQVIEGDATPEGYTVEVGTNWNGPWTTIGMATGTQHFDLAGSGLGDFRYIRIEDDGDGMANTAGAGFDIDAVEGRLIPSTGPFVMASDYSIDDSNTNNNGVLEAGETVSLTLQLENMGVDPAQNVYVKISSGDPMLTVLSDSAWYGNLGSGQQGNVGPYTISVDINTPHNSNLNLVVDINADGGYNWTHPIQLNVREGAKISTNSQSINFSNVFLNVTEEFSLVISNSGSDSLHINQFQTSLSQFWVEQTSLSIAPGAQQSAIVKFMPNDTINYSDTLVISNNDPNNFIYEIPLSGSGVFAPDISVGTDSISVTVTPNDSLVVTLPVSNVGPGNLIFTSQIGNYQPGNNALDSTGAGDSFGHIWIDSDEPGGPQYNWIDLSGGVGTQIPLSGVNSTSNTIPIGFDVPYYNDTFSSLRVCNNGWISFSAFSISYNNTQLPSNFAPPAMIAPLWDNLMMQTDSKVYYLQETNRFIVEWQNVYTVGGNGPYTFELMIHDDGNIILQFNTLTNLDTGYTVGMQNSSATDGFAIAYNEPYLHDQLAILIYRSSWVSVSPNGGTIAPSGSMDLFVTFKTDSFPTGDFWASVEINSNDPDEPLTVIPVHMKVADSVNSITNAVAALPRDYKIEQNYPNPFNPSTTIRYQLPQKEYIELTIYNINGQKIRTLISGEQQPGYHKVVWDGLNNQGRQVASGIYFYQIKSDNFMSTKRMLLLK